MGRFGRKPVPEWASFFTWAEYERFLRLVEEHFRASKLAVQIDEGVVYLDSGRALGLQNLAQMCHNRPREAWSEIIRTHFEIVPLADAAAERLEEDRKDFDKIKGLLKTRIYPRSYLDHAGVRLIHREVAEEDAIGWGSRPAGRLDAGFFTTTHALFLEDHLGPMGDPGMLSSLNDLYPR